jgi:soluble lytic murein transglycosylase-like protein
VAFAAGTMSFAANAQPNPPVTKQYLFQTSSGATKPEKAGAENGKKKTVGKRSTKAQAGKKQLAKATAGKRGGHKKRNGRKRIVIDTLTTASIATGPDERVSASGRYDGFVAQYASSNGVPVSLAHAVISIESNYRVNALGSAGEIGLMQIKPATARMMGYRGSTRGLYDPETNIRYGMKYLGLAHKLGGGATCRTILKYNAGHAASRMNPVSSAYCGKVIAQLGG